MPVTIYSAQVTGLEAQPISVEVDITPGLHTFSIVGLADKEVQESRERIAAAIKNLGGLAPHKKSQRVIVNLAPADLRKEGPAFDVPIALGYLLASNQISFEPRGRIFLGELGLDGGIRRVPGALAITMAARVAGFTEIFVPPGNGREAALLDGITVYEVGHLTDLVEYFSGRKILTPIPATTISSDKSISSLDFKDIHGQEKAKRALEIAAAGNHNLLMSGPPGAGKTILAQTLPSILPPLSLEEALEVTRIYSVAGLLTGEEPFARNRPFRHPHHTSSYVSIIGGGAHPRPGEATLAHRGVLFLDELPEFDRRVIEALRQPLEERTITVARSQGVVTFPAQFILIAAMNPCPCGHHGDPRKDCVCSPGVISKYRKKISGPLLDRIDLHIHTPAVEYEKLEKGEEEESSAAIREKVLIAREFQERRFRGTGIRTNAEMGIRELKQFIRLSEPHREILKSAHERYNLSARSYHRVLKLARTIADTERSEELMPEHVSEALQYRPKEDANLG